jgi:UDP-N-acetylmuramyl tripeptide synthase
MPGRFNEGNAAMAAAALGEMGIHGVDDLWVGITSVNGRYASVDVDGRRARLLLAKNPAGWTEVLKFLAGAGSGVVVALNCQIADGKDPSWLWDVPFELLAGRSVGASGQRYLDLAVRLRYAGVDFVADPDPLRAAEKVEGDDVEVVATYSAFVDLVRRVGSQRSA